MGLPLSLVIITLNEENNVSRCIQSVPFAQEIIVVDSLSTDRTREIAKSLGAKVIEKSFLGYREQKQFALNQATLPWVLSLDADETLSAELKAEIEGVLKSPDSQAYRMPRLSFHLGRWIRHGGWFPDYQTRLFKRDSGSWFGGTVHEVLKVKGTTKTLRNNICHYVFKDLSDQIQTNNEFSSLGALQLIEKKEKFSLVKLIFRPVGKFVECYLFKRGFLDGVPGLIIALGAAQSLFLKYSKLWESELLNESK
jgi:glycosyltransferase involved in cell wall biosynthesis